jgi:hypothetical protein
MAADTLITNSRGGSNTSPKLIASDLTLALNREKVASAVSPPSLKSFIDESVRVVDLLLYLRVCLCLYPDRAEDTAECSDVGDDRSQ